MKKLPQILLITLLLSAGIAKAQTASDVYEYATVITVVGTKGVAIGVSYSNGDYKETDFDKNDFKPGGIGLNQAPILKYIAQMSKDGWDIVNFSYSTNMAVGNLPTYLLKRKQK